METKGVRIKSSTGDQSIKVIELSGKIDTITTDKISQEVMGVFEQNPGGLLFNLHEVTFVSSAGLRMFLSAYKKGAAADIKMAMCHVHPSVYKIFKVGGLETAFKIFNDEPQALKEVWGIEIGG